MRRSWSSIDRMGRARRSTSRSYLAAVSAEWKLRAGSGLMVAWPTGRAAEGNEGVARAVKATRNAIGYVEYAQANQLGLAHVLLQNRSGRFVAPDAATFQAAAAGADWSAARRLPCRADESCRRAGVPDRRDCLRAREQDRAKSEDSSRARLLPLVAAEGQRYRHDARLCAPPARARAAGRSLLGTNLSGRELTNERLAQQDEAPGSSRCWTGRFAVQAGLRAVTRLRSPAVSTNA